MANISRRSFNLALASLSGTALLGAGPRRASAQSWPARPVTIVMPFAAGGGGDSLARAVAAELSEKIGGGRFIVENRTGAGGNIGGAAVAKAEPTATRCCLQATVPARSTSSSTRICNMIPSAILSRSFTSAKSRSSSPPACRHRRRILRN